MSQPPPNLPNILFITADQWRADSVGYAGNRLAHTPSLDALAAEGVAFLNHYANAAPCSPARACLYTGLYQMTNRVCRNGSPLDDRFDNIARAARRAGYEPTLFGYTDQSPDPRRLAPGDPDARSYEGVLPGFLPRLRLLEDEKPWLTWLRRQGVAAAHRKAAHAFAGVPAEPVPAAPPSYDATQTPTAFLTDAFLDWLDEQERHRPWFAHLSYLRPHPPFVVPAPYNALVDPGEVEGFRRAASWQAEAELHPLLAWQLEHTRKSAFVIGAEGLVRDFTEADFRQIKATYHGMIAEVDAQLGRVFGALRAAGAWDDTLVVFTSDHAELMGDHWLLGKGGFFDQSQRVPLIIRDPRHAAAHGRRVDAFTEAVDITPTLLERIGEPLRHHPDGLPLTPFLAGESPAGWRNAAHWEFDFRDIAGGKTERRFGLPSTRLSMAVLRTSRHKYVHFSGLKPLLFDLERDADELVDRAGDPAYLGIRVELAERLLAWRAEHLDQTLALTELTETGVVRREERHG